MPQIGVSAPVYLQFPDAFALAEQHSVSKEGKNGNNAGLRSLLGEHGKEGGPPNQDAQFQAQRHHPYGTVILPKDVLISNQFYDVNLRVCLPRSPGNLGMGNFMMDVEVFGTASPSATNVASSSARTSDSSTILARSSRPAILTYQSDMVSKVATLLKLSLYILDFAREMECVTETVMEDAAFSSSPSSIKVQLRTRSRGVQLSHDTVGAGVAGSMLDVYNVHVSVSARLTGLRWLLYNHRIISFVLFTTVFWGVSVSSSAIIWLLLSVLVSKFTLRTRTRKEASAPTAKEVRPARDFARDSPLETSDLAPVKREDDEPIIKQEEPGNAGDNEEEDVDFILPAGKRTGDQYGGEFADSGLGTSLESGNASGLVGLGSETIRRRQQQGPRYGGKYR